MAPSKTSKPKETAKYYRDNPDAYKKKLEYDKKYGSKKSEREDRSDHNEERRKRGVYGKGGDDMSRKKDGSFVAEDPSTNRARNRGRK
jgi:hypothetical protein